MSGCATVTVDELTTVVSNTKGAGVVVVETRNFDNDLKWEVRIDAPDSPSAQK